MAKEFKLDDDQVAVYEEMEKAIALAKKLFKVEDGQVTADMATWVHDSLFLMGDEDDTD